MNHNRITGIQWLPFILIIIGLILKWIHIDERGLILNIGFVVFGIVGLGMAIKSKYYKQFNLDIIRIILPIVIILLACDTLLTGKAHYAMSAVAATKCIVWTMADTSL